MEKYSGIPAEKLAGWESLPHGWTEESVKSMWNSWKKKNPEHPTTECIKHMRKKVTNPEAFCASLRDKATGTTKWRKGPKKKD